MKLDSNVFQCGDKVLYSLHSGTISKYGATEKHLDNQVNLSRCSNDSEPSSVNTEEEVSNLQKDIDELEEGGLDGIK